MTLVEYLNLPRNQAGFAAGAFTVANRTANFSSTDSNGDGVICVKDVAALNGDAGPWPFFYNVVDDNASASTG